MGKFLVLKTMNNEGTAQVFQNGGEVGEPGTAIWQLQHPNPDNPTYLVNAEPRLAKDLIMRIPTALLKKLTPYGSPDFGVNVTPMHTIVDIHIDQGRESLVQCIGSGRKIFLMWPATDHNMRLMRNFSDQPMRLFRMADQLQGGIMTAVDASVGLATFAGTIHATITLEPGLLVGITWISAENHRPAARCFKLELSTDVEENLPGLFRIIADQIESSLQGFNSDRHREVLQDWTTYYPLMVRKCANMPAGLHNPLERLLQVFEDFFCRYRSLQWSCCGSGTCNPEHFQDVHLGDLQALYKEARPSKKARHR